MAKYAYHRTDANAEEIFCALEQAGCSVYRGGPLDAIVGRHGHNYLMEIKTARGKLRASQKAFLEAWRGNAFVVRNVDEAFDVIGATKNAAR